MRGSDEEMRRRDGFKLTDDRGTMRDALYEIDYCMICHERGKDSCSTGIHEKDGSVKSNPLGIKTDGCPLDEKISEMHLLKKQGDPIGSLALVTIDNPMCAGTVSSADCMRLHLSKQSLSTFACRDRVADRRSQLPYGLRYSL